MRIFGSDDINKLNFMHEQSSKFPLVNFSSNTCGNASDVTIGIHIE